MIKLSLRIRSFVAALLVLLFFIPLSAITLEQAFINSLTQSMLEQLRVQSLTLISEFEMEQEQPAMPEQLFNDKLNIPGSGLYAFIEIDDAVVWQSLSTLNWQQQPELNAPEIGNEIFEPSFTLISEYFLFAYTAEFESQSGFVPVSFFIIQDKLVFEQERAAFANTLWYWLGFIALLLLVLLLFSLSMALKPIDLLIQQINQAERGEISRIAHPFPPELEKLKNSINHLLDTEEQQRSRYKNSLSDLAHSLKTPLAVLSGTRDLPEPAREPLNQINNIIQRQLKRAVAGAGSGWEQAEPIKPVVDKLVGAMKKVYADKKLTFSSEIEAECQFRGDTTDLLELLGNLIDNASKAARTRVVVKASQQINQLIFVVADDGPGIDTSQRQALLLRGNRLDSYQEGQGIGLAVVSDLVSAYNGQLEIGDSDLGGAEITLRFPL